MRKFLFLIVAVLFACPAFAENSKAYDGLMEYVKTGTSYTGLKVNGTLSYDASTEAISTDDTLTADESGKVIAITGNDVTLTLPTYAAGLSYNVVSDGSYTFDIAPGASDKIKYSTFVFVDGQAITSTAGVTSDSIEVVGVNGDWLVVSANGTIGQG